jgi:hypothetical protein
MTEILLDLVRVQRAVPRRGAVMKRQLSDWAESSIAETSPLQTVRHPTIV